MPAYELTTFDFDEEAYPRDRRRLWVIGDLSSVMQATAGTRANVQLMPHPMQAELHPAHADVDYVLPGEADRLRQIVLLWS